MTPEIEKHDMANGNITKKKIMANNFLGGLMWGIGSAIGATVMVAILLGVLAKLHYIPGFQDLIPEKIQVNQYK